MQVESQHEDGEDHRGHDLQRDHGDHVRAEEEEEAEERERSRRGEKKSKQDEGEKDGALMFLPFFHSFVKSGPWKWKEKNKVSQKLGTHSRDETKIFHNLPFVMSRKTWAPLKLRRPPKHLEAKVALL